MTTEKAAPPMPQLGWGKIQLAVRLTLLSQLVYDWRESNSIILIEKRKSTWVLVWSFGFYRRTKFSYKICCNLRLQLYSISLIGGEFWQIHHWIISFSYTLHTCKISRKLKINSYIIKKKIKIASFGSLKLCIKYKLIDHIINNIWLI